MKPINWRDDLSRLDKWRWYYEFLRGGEPRDSRLRAAIKALRMSFGGRCRLHGGW